MSNAHSKTKRARVFSMYEGKCAYCGEPIAIGTFHIEHVVPKSSGGTNEYVNLMPSCEGCNRTKRTWSIDDFRIRLAVKQATNGISFNAEQIELLKATGCLDLLGVNQNLRFYFETMKKDEGQE
ncbi:HNH endonuclease [Aeromonas caviae]|uniref:HNH endonuclease n=1 Tax=Aeromonas caviae TaxID=648 RepID=UPI002B4767EE|nr:HNH endonuclease signature motif containing protein [Aeromonas caviae]